MRDKNEMNIEIYKYILLFFIVVFFNCNSTVDYIQYLDKNENEYSKIIKDDDIWVYVNYPYQEPESIVNDAYKLWKNKILSEIHVIRLNDKYNKIELINLEIQLLNEKNEEISFERIDVNDLNNGNERKKSLISIDELTEYLKGKKNEFSIYWFVYPKFKYPTVTLNMKLSVKYGDKQYDFDKTYNLHYTKQSGEVGD